MKKLFLFATLALFVAGSSFADTGKKKKKCAKAKSCTSAEKKACHQSKADKTVKL
jgi:hypothetical protein